MDFDSRLRKRQQEFDRSWARMRIFGIVWSVLCLGGAVVVALTACHFIAKWW